MRGQGWSRDIDLPPGEHITLGRGDRAHVKIDRKSVSHEHLSFEWTGEEVRIRDLGSSYGTFRLPQNSPFQEGNFPLKFAELALRLAKEDVTLSWEPLLEDRVDSTALLERTRAERTRAEPARVVVEKTTVEPAAIGETPVPEATSSGRGAEAVELMIGAEVSSSAQAQPHVSDAASAPSTSVPIAPELLALARLRGARVFVLAAAFLLLLTSMGATAVLLGRGFVRSALFASNTGALKDLYVLWSGLCRVHAPVLALSLLAICLLMALAVRRSVAGTQEGFLAAIGRVLPLPGALGVPAACALAALAFVWPYAWGLVRGLPFERIPQSWHFAEVFLPETDLRSLPTPEVVARIDELRGLRRGWEGSSLLYKTLFEYQRTRVLRECGGVGERPWEAKKVCLVLLSAVAIETYGDVRPTWTAEIADRVALLLALDGVTRVISVEGVQSPFLPFFLDSLATVGLDDEREDLSRLLADSKLKPATVRQILGELRRRIEVRLETRQRELRLSRPFRVIVPGPLESGI